MGFTRKQRKKRSRTRLRRKRINLRIQTGGSVNLKDITLGILSWKAPLTIKNTLESYRKNGLLDLVTPFLFFQEISETDKQIANSFSIPYIGSPTNIHIKGALMEMVKHTKTPYFCFAEMDFELIHPKEHVITILTDAITLMRDHNIQYVKLRDRKNPGEPLGSRNMEYSRDYTFPFKLEAMYFIEKPEEKWPGVYKIIDLQTKWYTCTSKDNKWSNNIFIAPTEWLRSTIIPLLEAHPENNLVEDIVTENVPVFNQANGEGLFKHNRLDR